MKWLFLVLFIGPIYTADIDDSMRPMFRILAPQVICKVGKNQTSEQPSQITISMQTKNGQKLFYKTEIYFESLGGYRGQRHTLKLWDAIRRLQVKINTKDRDLISLRNQININNTQLISGVFYIFKIVGYDSNGVASKADNFTVNFSDGKIKRTNPDGTIIPDDVSFLIIGSEQTYADVDNLVVADVSFCDGRSDYYMKWSINNLPEKVQNIFQIPGQYLDIPAGTLKGGEFYRLTGSLVQSNDSKVILSAFLNINVKQRGFSGLIIPKNILIGISQPLELKLVLFDSDNVGIDPQIEWSCQSDEEVLCQNFEPSTNTSQIVEAFKEGVLNVSASVRYNNETLWLSAIVSVNSNVIALPELKTIPSQVYPAGSNVELETTLHHLIPGCYAYWDVKDEPNFQYFNISKIPGGLGNTTILDIEENFLSELVDYVNNTLTRDIKLTIPMKNAFPNWNGLEPDVRYKFRLNITCPVPINENDSPTNRPNITSFLDVVIETNQPPIGQPLEVEPINGIPMITIFKFSTGVAKDIETDYPLKYTFQYQINDLIIKIGEFYENMVTTSVIPYSELPILSMVEICDSREACSVQFGPKITTNLTILSTNQIGKLLEKINASINRMDYEDGFNLALALIISLKNMNDLQNYQIIQESMIALITNQCQWLKNHSNNDWYVSNKKIIDFIRLSKQIVDIIGNQTDTIRKLLDLLHAQRDNGKQLLNDNQIMVSRRKRSANVKNGKIAKDTPVEKLKITLNMFESLFKSENETVLWQEKQQLLKLIEQSIVRICQTNEDSSKAFRILGRL